MNVTTEVPNIVECPMIQLPKCIRMKAKRKLKMKNCSVCLFISCSCVFFSMSYRHFSSMTKPMHGIAGK